MVWVPLKNGSGQVVKDIKLKSPDNKTYTVVSNSRKGINRYEITLKASDGSTKKVMNQYLEQVPDFTTLFERKTPTQVQGMLDEFLLGDEAAEENSQETQKYKTNSDSGKVSSVDEAFADFLG